MISRSTLHIVQLRLALMKGVCSEFCVCPLMMRRSLRMSVRFVSRGLGLHVSGVLLGRSPASARGVNLLEDLRQGSSRMD